MDDCTVTGRWPSADDRLLEDIKSERLDLEGDVTFMRVTAGLLEQAAAEIRAKQRTIDELECRLRGAEQTVQRLKEQHEEVDQFKAICGQYQYVK